MNLSTTRITVIFGVLGLVALVGLGWLLVLSPRLQEADRVSERAATMETTNLQQLNRYNDLVAKAREIPKAAAEAEKLFASMPQEADIPDVLTQISKAAEQAGIPPADIQTINTSVPVPVGDPATQGESGVALATMQVDVTVKGTDEQLKKFLDNLQALDRSILVQSTNVTAANGASTLQVTGQMFVLQSPLEDLVQTVKKVVEEADLPQPQ